MSNMKRYISQNSIRKKQSHFMNSVFEQSGIYSRVEDCFLEVSRHVFLPESSKLTKRSEFMVEILAAYQLFENLFGCI